MEFHYIQEQILRQLTKIESSARYSELQIEGIENDLFNYHLQKLVRLGLISKTGPEYRLSNKGKQLVEDILPIGVLRQKADMFKLYSHGIVIRKGSKDLQILNRKRTSHPPKHMCN